MSNQLVIKSKYTDSYWVIECEVAETSEEDFPREIFLWTLDDAGRLQEFQFIGHLDQIAKYPLYDSNRTNNFGIHVVRYDSSRQQVSTEEEKNDVITVLKAAFDSLLIGYVTQSIEVEETYP